MNVTFLGTTDDVTTCDCCGRQNLKSTVALSLDGADPMYYGVTCAAHAMRCDERYVRTEARRADRAKADQAAAAKAVVVREAQQSWFAWLAVHGAGDNTFSRIESLGGYNKARSMFRGSVAA